ncbi:MAG: hypothetical protein QG608_2202 [Actinomycetota bacterium]|nr:hypothetical protein [Actinomycetota bacterium]
MLLLVALDGDPWAPVLSRVAQEAGTEVRLVDDLRELRFDVRVDRRGNPRCAVRTVRGDVPEGIVFRGGTVLAQDGGFGGSEHLAAWWALLAAFDGPVVNRPTRHGPLLTVDRLRTRRAAGVGVSAWTLREPWPAVPASRAVPAVTVVRRAADHRPVAPSGPDGCSFVADETLEVIESTAATVLWVLIAGERFLVPAGKGTLDLPGEAADRLRRILEPDLPALARLVVEFDREGDCRVLDADPLPGTDLLGEAVQDAASAVLACVTRGAAP